MLATPAARDLPSDDGSGIVYNRRASEATQHSYSRSGAPHGSLHAPSVRASMVGNVPHARRASAPSRRVSSSVPAAALEAQQQQEEAGWQFPSTIGRLLGGSRTRTLALALFPLIPAAGAIVGESRRCSRTRPCPAEWTDPCLDDAQASSSACLSQITRLAAAQRGGSGLPATWPSG